MRKREEGKRKRGGGKRRKERERVREGKREGSTTYPLPYFPLQRLPPPPIETKPQVLPYFPSVFPLLSCKSFLRECSSVTHSTRLSLSLLSFPFLPLSFASRPMFTPENYLFAYYILNGFRIPHVRAQARTPSVFNDAKRKGTCR